MPLSARRDPWGSPPWNISFTPQRHKLPAHVDFAVIGGGFTGLAAAAWLRLLAPEKSVAVFEAARIGAHICTCPPSVIDALYNHPLTSSGLEKFLKDWEKSQAVKA